MVNTTTTLPLFSDPAPEAEPVRPPAPLPALHRIHACPTSGKGGRSFDLAGYRWRPADASGETHEAQQVAFRMALCWNLCEGITTDGLAGGALLDEAQAVGDLVTAIERGADLEELRQLAGAVRAAGGLVEAATDRSHGRLHDCPSCLGGTP